MDTRQQIEIMQAYLDGKTIQYQVHNDGWKDVVGEPVWTWVVNNYRVKPDDIRPKTWEEFCKTHPIQKGEAYISMESNSIVWEGNSEHRSADRDRIFLPNKQLAEAMIALCQLIQLRDCYNQGWKPNWSDETIKYEICFYDNEIVKGRTVKNSSVLSFENEELRDEFAENFKELIEEAKELI